MTTAKQLIEYLQTLPEETIISVVVTDGCNAYFTDLDLGENSYYCDMEGNPYVKEDSPVYGKKFLELGID